MMITRIVKLTFKQECIDDFISLYDASEVAIKAMPGNLYLSLHRDTNTPNIFFTISQWQSEQDLEIYRHSTLFEQVWATTKSYFSDKPQAWSIASLQALGIWQ